jgi:hypothetical protein
VLEGAIATPGTALDARATADTLYVVQGAGGLIAIPTGKLPAP